METTPIFDLANMDENALVGKIGFGEAKAFGAVRNDDSCHISILKCF